MWRILRFPFKIPYPLVASFIKKNYNFRMKLNVYQFKAIAESLIAHDDYVIWVCDPLYQQQIYLSPSYEKLWEQSCTEIYNDLTAWQSSLVDMTGEHLRKLYTRLPELESRNVAHYVINTRRTQQKRFIRDTCFYLYADPPDECIAIAGIVQELSERQWLEEGAQYDLLLQARIDDFQLKLKDMGLMSSSAPRASSEAQKIVDAKLIELSNRQLECLYYMLQGQSLKQVAAKLFRSPRTIETHMNMIKDKFECRRVVELASKISVQHVERLLAKEKKSK